ncbi:MAG: hypothetical protein OZ948_10230 [Deltaproteobacteria bacterium]|nr:hypothetical protein [Deltaproteobacteria bacterium]
MALLALLGYGAFVLVSLVVGVRLLLLWRGTRETPELAIGVTLTAGGLSFALGIAAFSAPELPRAAAASIEMISGFAAHLASAALALALRHIFRPDERWARALQLALTVALAGSFLLRLVDPLAFPPPPFVFWPYMLLGAGIYAWSAVEALLCWQETARRARLGLAEPGLARRFLLWAVAGTAALGIYVLAMVDRALQPGTMSPVMITSMSLLGIAAAVGLSSAFFPHDRSGLALLRGGRPGD